MTQLKTHFTVEEFLSLPEGDITYELVDGELKPKMSPKRFHSKLTGTIYTILTQWAQDIGEVGIEWAIRLKRRGKDWVPIADLLYISYSRLGRDPVEDTACPLPPDLAIEIISPDQTFGEITAKASDYLNAGVLRVWVVDAKSKTITVCYPDAAMQTKSGEDSLEDALFSGLQFIVQQVFQDTGIV